MKLTAVRLSVVVLLLAVAGCGAKSSEPKAKPELTELQYWALTGLPNSGNSAPVVVAKIDNTHASKPQLGLDKAELVTEELVEGGFTRLAVFFQKELPKTIGPIRSMRASDIGLVKPVAGSFLTSGGFPATNKRVTAAGLRFFENIDKQPKHNQKLGFYRDQTRNVPYNLFINTTKILDDLPKLAPSQGYFNWGNNFPKGKAVRTIDARFSAAAHTAWKLNNGNWVNSNSNAQDPFVANTVIVVRVVEGDAGYLDPAGNPVPEAKTIGRGVAQIFHAGRVVRATWVKPSFSARYRFLVAGKEINIPVGKVWLEVLPNDKSGGRLRFGK